MLVAEDRGENLGLGRILEAVDLLFRLGRHVGLQRMHVFLDADRDLLADAAHEPAATVARSVAAGAVTACACRCSGISVFSVFLSHDSLWLSVDLFSVQKAVAPSDERDRYTPCKNAPGSLKWLGCPLGH